MSATHVTVTVRNLAEPQREWNGLFRVDPSSVDCIVFAKRLREVGIEARGVRRRRLPNGTVIEMDVGGAQLEFLDEVVGATIIFGPDDAEPTLGWTALQSAGIEFDPETQRLRRLPAVRLKSAAKVFSR